MVDIKHFIGIDGGGTFCRLVVINMEKRIMFKTTGGSTNLTSNSIESVRENLEELLSEVKKLHPPNECGAVYFGSAAAKVPKNADRLIKIFNDAGYQCIIRIVSDAELLLSAETKGKPGAVLISGTGSVCFARDNFGKIHRFGGWGHIIGDEGSGYKIGLDAIKAAFLAHDGQGPETVLSQMILNELQLNNMDELLAVIYNPTYNKASVARLAPLVNKAANEKDEVSLQIEATAVNDLFRLAYTALKNTNIENETLVYSGGTINHYNKLRLSLCEKLKSAFPNLNIHTAVELPEIGAALLAHEDYKKSLTNIL